MSHHAFIDSACALGKFFVLFAAAGFSGLPEKQIFAGTRLIGLEAEREMFRTTGGVNTHKGMIFALGVTTAAAAKALFEKKGFGGIRGVVRVMTSGLVEGDLGKKDVRQKADPTHGERIYLRHKLAGVRGEVEAGLPTVFELGLPCYESCADLPPNDRLVQALMAIMSRCEDTNIVHRHSLETLAEVRNRAGEFMAAGGMRTDKGRGMAGNMQAEFAARNISPGGSADLLGITVFLSCVRREYDSLEALPEKK
jgi:triphosphoribosyl-dephospho-CoA synthase